jgi:hypothetical protein
MIHAYAVFYWWFVEDGWISLLTAANLILFVRSLFYVRRVSVRLRLIEFSHQGLLGRITDLASRTSSDIQAVRRATENFGPRLELPPDLVASPVIGEKDIVESIDETIIRKKKKKGK